MTNKGSGWHGEPKRHSEAVKKGLKTRFSKPKTSSVRTFKRTTPKQIQKDYKLGDKFTDKYGTWAIIGFTGNKDQYEMRKYENGRVFEKVEDGDSLRKFYKKAILPLTVELWNDASAKSRKKTLKSMGFDESLSQHPFSYLMREDSAVANHFNDLVVYWKKEGLNLDRLI